MKKCIDSHVHLDLVYRHHPQRIPWLRENGCAVISWAFSEDPIESVSDLEAYLAAKARLMTTLGKTLPTCYYMAGVHPRNISRDLRPEHVETLLEPYLEDQLCIGVGEIGLERGSSHEEEIFLAQLELAPRLRKTARKFGVHTPRQRKGPLTEKLLALLGRIPETRHITVVDHCSEETLGPVLAAGYTAGVTLNPAKASAEALRSMIDANPSDTDRILCNTDSGTDFFEDLVQTARDENLSPEHRLQLFFQNAERFFQIASF